MNSAAKLVVVGGLCLAAGWGLGKHQEDASRGLAARVNGEGIANTDVISELQTRFGSDVLQDMVNRALILQEARRQKIEVSPAELDAALEKMKSNPQVQAELDGGKTTEADLRRNLTTLLPLDKLAEKHITTEDEKQYLLDHRDELETVQVSQIVVSSELEATAVLHRLQKGANFAQLAGDCSLDPNSKDKGGDLGELHRAQMEPQIAEILFKLQPGQLSGIVRTDVGFHVFRVEAHRFEYTQLQPAIHAILVDAKRSEVLEGLRTVAKIEVSKPYKLVEILPTGTPTPSADQN